MKRKERTDDWGNGKRKVRKRRERHIVVDRGREEGKGSRGKGRKMLKRKEELTTEEKWEGM